MFGLVSRGEEDAIKQILKNKLIDYQKFFTHGSILGAVLGCVTDDHKARMIIIMVMALVTLEVKLRPK